MHDARSTSEHLVHIDSFQESLLPSSNKPAMRMRCNGCIRQAWDRVTDSPSVSSNLVCQIDHNWCFQPRHIYLSRSISSFFQPIAPTRTQIRLEHKFDHGIKLAMLLYKEVQVVLELACLTIWRTDQMATRYWYTTIRHQHHLYLFIVCSNTCINRTLGPFENSDIIKRANSPDRS